MKKNNIQKMPKAGQVGNGTKPHVSGSLPDGFNAKLLERLLLYSNKYEISIQFWPEQIAVYISKDGVSLQDYGGSFLFAVRRSLEYLDRITGRQ